MNSSFLWETRQSGQTRGRSMERTIYSRPKAPKPKTNALELPDDHTPTDPSPRTQHSALFGGRDRRYLSPGGRGERQGSHSPDQPTSISTGMLGDRAQFRVGIQPNGLVLVALLVRRDVLLGRHRDETIGIAGLGKAATTLGRSIPPPRQLRPLRFARGL